MRRHLKKKPIKKTASRPADRGVEKRYLIRAREETASRQMRPVKPEFVSDKRGVYVAGRSVVVRGALSYREHKSQLHDRR